MFFNFCFQMAIISHLYRLSKAIFCYFFMPKTIRIFQEQPTVRFTTAAANRTDSGGRGSLIRLAVELPMAVVF
jgi:hypothetical protein